MTDLVGGLIAAGDVVVVRGEASFFEALLAALGDRAVALVNADLDTPPDVHLTMDGDRPVVTRLKPAVVPQYVPDADRVFLIYAGETARQRDDLCGLAPVVLDGVSATFARVLKAGGAEAFGTGLQIIDGKPVPTRLSV